MITDTFDNKSDAIINPIRKENAPKVDVCIVTFSYIIEDYILKNYNCKKIAEIEFATGITPIYQFDYNNKKIAVFKTYVGAPACVGSIEDATVEIDTDKFILFGGCGCLDRKIAHGRIIVPTEAYRDEGTSYHYTEVSDYIKVKNSIIVEQFMKEKGLPYALGKTWTTDSFYRETRNNFEKHKKDGCIAVEMECAGVQAMCNFRNLEFYTFFTSGDLLDAPEWDKRHEEGEYAGTQHDYRHFEIALELGDYITRKN